MLIDMVFATTDLCQAHGQVFILQMRKMCFEVLGAPWRCHSRSTKQEVTKFRLGERFYEGGRGLRVHTW
jgi:hypothetical protein